MAAVADMKIGLPYPMCDSTWLRYTVTSISEAVQFELLQEIWYRTNPLLRAMPLLRAAELCVDLDAEVLVAGDDF
jgi:hypothetical protein